MGCIMRLPVIHGHDESPSLDVNRPVNVRVGSEIPDLRIEDYNIFNVSIFGSVAGTIHYTSSSKSYNRN
jgi:hypothetical protein